MSTDFSDTKMEGIKTCPKWLKDAYRKAVNYTCTNCHKHEYLVGFLVPHRIIQGRTGGTYAPNNVKMCCVACHKLFHYKNNRRTGE